VRPTLLARVPKIKKTTRRRSGTKATIHDVAERAGVTIYTVSRTLNNAVGVNPATRERVLEICRQLGIRPRVTSQRKHFALVIHNDDRTNSPSYTGMLTFELLAEVSSRGMALSIFADDQVPEMTRQIFDGVFALTWNEASLKLLGELRTTPVVVVNRFGFAPRFHVVGWDHREEGRIVADYLIKRGHRRLAMVAEPSVDVHSTQSRATGFREQAGKAGLAAQAVTIELLETRSQLATALARVLAFKADALYVPGQGMLGPESAEILQHVLKVRIPEDISLVAGEHAGWSSIFCPPITSVDAPLRQLATRCVEHALNLIQHHRTKPVEVLMATPIIERKSVMDRRAIAPV
jgi:LacI family transcriptional regulator